MKLSILDFDPPDDEERRGELCEETGVLDSFTFTLLVLMKWMLRSQ